MQRDRQQIGALDAAVNGSGSSRSESGKKRPREDDRSTSGGRRTNPFTSGDPWKGLGQNNLYRSNRSKPRGVDIGSSSGLLPSLSTNHSQSNSLAHSAFPRLANGSKALPLEENVANGFSVFEESASTRTGQSTVLDPSGGVLTFHNVGTVDGALSRIVDHSRPSNPNLSPEINQIMSGKEEFSLAEVFDSAPPPSPSYQSGAELSGPATSERRSGSADPIDLISQSGQPASRNIQPIIIEDDIDDADDDVVEEILKQPPPGTPTGKTLFREGHVREKVREASSRSTVERDASAPGKSMSRREPRPGGTVSSATKTGHEPGPPTLITVGFTRPAGTVPPVVKPAAVTKSAGGTKSAAASKPSIVRSMKNKAGSGLRLATLGPQPKNPPASKDFSRKQQVNPSAPSLEEFEIKVEEWYCGGTKHGAGKTGRDQHKFRCNSKGIITLGQDKSESLTLMPRDFKEFEVAESSEGTALDEEEFMPVLSFAVQEKCGESPSWRKFSGGDPSSRLVVKFDASDGMNERKWRQYVDRLAYFMPKSILKVNAMKGLLKFQQAGANTFAQPNKKQARPKPAKTHRTENPDTVPPEVPPTIFGPSTRTRTRAAAAPLKDESQRTPPVQAPLQDPDEIMLVYPQSGTGAVNINRAELLRLEPGEFLNDTLIELGLKLWLNELRTTHPELVDQIHVFNSFFFKKLDSGRGRPCDYNSVKKWTSKIDLFKKRFIIVPINEHLHWYLAIICFPEHVLRAPAPQPPPQPTRKTRSSNAGTTKNDEPRASPESDMLNAEQISIVDVDAGSPLEQGQMEVDSYLADRSQSMVLEDVEMATAPPEAAVNMNAKPAASAATPPILDMTGDDLASEDQDNVNAQKCWILIFDSLRGKHNRTVRILREYLQAEARERHGKSVETKDSTLSGGLVEDKHLPVPEQPNWCDCGVYLLHYVEAFVANPLELLALPAPKRKSSPEEVARYDRLWQKEKVVEKRADFREQVTKLSKDWRQSKSKGPQDGPSITEGSTSDARRASPLPNTVGEPSIIEIDPPSARTPTKEPATPTLARRPLRSGTLPLLPADAGLSSPRTHDLSSLPDQDREVNVVDPSSPDNDTRASEDMSSVSGHKRTRRRTKGGERHTHPSWGRETKSSVSSVEL